LVYKITAPTPTSQPPGDFAQNAGTIPSQKPTIKQLPKPIKAAQTASADTTASNQSFQPLPQPNAMSSGTPAGVPVTTPHEPIPVVAFAPMPQPTEQPAPVTTTVTTTTTAPVTPAAPVTAEATPVVTTTTATAPTSVLATTAPAENYYNPAHPNATLTVVNGSSPNADPVVALQQANAKLAADVSQKLADTQAENTALEGKLEDLNMRLASIETTLAHLGKAIQDVHAANAPAPRQPAIVRAADAIHSAFSVQAIIPGRAWLKSENGETVTVAEGDILKNYGRIMKIDPYDGVVQVDANGKIMTLSYGVTSE
jgi:hypothetical protein